MGFRSRSVRTEDIQDGAVTTAKLAESAMAHAKAVAVADFVNVPQGSTSDVELISCALAANELSVGDIVILETFGGYDNPSDASPTSPTFKVKRGATALASVARYTPPASVAQSINFFHNVRAVIKIVSASTARAHIEQVNMTGNTVATSKGGGDSLSTVAFDITQAQTVSLTMAHGETTAGYAGYQSQAFVQIIKAAA